MQSSYFQNLRTILLALITITFIVGCKSDPIELLRTNVKKWNQWREKNPNQEIDIFAPDLKKARLDYVNLQKVSFESADFSNAEIRYSNLSQANLKHARMIAADLRDTILTKTNFAQADLSRTSFQNALLQGANMKQAKIINSDFRKANVSRADFRKSILKKADFRGAVYDSNTQWPQGFDPKKEGLILAGKKENMIGQDLSNIRFGRMDLSGANMMGTKLLGTDLSHTNLKGANLFASLYDSQTKWPVGFNLAKHKCVQSGSLVSKRDEIFGKLDNLASGPSILANHMFKTINGMMAKDYTNRSLVGLSLHKASMTYCTFQRTNFSHANLSDSSISFSELDKATFLFANLKNVSFLLNQMNSTDFRYANLRNAKFTASTIRNVDFRYADLRGANLRVTRLSSKMIAGSQLKGARYDAKTKWPKNFDPQKAGAIFVKSK